MSTSIIKTIVKPLNKSFDYDSSEEMLVSCKKQTSIYNLSKSNRLYALGKPVETWLTVPGKAHTFWKDENNTLLGANEATAKATIGLDIKEVTGLSDLELVNKINQISKFKDYFEVKTQHIAWTNDDKMVFNSGRTLLFYNYVIGIKKCILFLSQKTPLYDLNDKIVGTFGLCFYLAERNLSNFKNRLELTEYISNFENQTKNQGNIPNRIILNNISLSAKETACAFYLSKGFTLKQIASKLTISPRTVEAHLCHIKEKIGCHSCTELTELLFNCGIF